MTDFFVVWKVTCLRHKDQDFGDTDKKRTFLVIDDGGDPNFYCQVCYAERNHLPPTKDWIEMINVKDPKYASTRTFDHYTELVGRVTYEDLEKLAKKDPRGWR